MKRSDSSGGRKPRQDNVVGFRVTPSMRDAGAGWYGTVLMMTAIVVLFVVLFGFLMRPAVVQGSSMLPTLEDGNVVLVEKLWGPPQNGEIVVLKSEQFSHPLVKRVIATAGQSVDIDYQSGKVYVDGEALDEPYLAEQMFYSGANAVEFPAIVPEGMLFVLGDNRNVSSDSRDFGFVPESAVLGKAFFRVFPFTGTSGLTANDEPIGVFD